MWLPVHRLLCIVAAVIRMKPRLLIRPLETAISPVAADERHPTSPHLLIRCCCFGSNLRPRVNGRSACMAGTHRGLDFLVSGDTRLLCKRSWHHECIASALTNQRPSLKSCEHRAIVTSTQNLGCNNLRLGESCGDNWTIRFATIRENPTTGWGRAI